MSWHFWLKHSGSEGGMLQTLLAGSIPAPALLYFPGCHRRPLRKGTEFTYTGRLRLSRRDRLGDRHR